MWEAAPGEYCFVEDISVAHFEKWAEQIILFKWNRKYPGDFYFDIDVQKPEWKLSHTEDFAGSSMKKLQWRYMTMRKLQKTFLPLLLAVLLCFTGCSGTTADADNTPSNFIADNNYLN